MGIKKIKNILLAFVILFLVSFSQQAFAQNVRVSISDNNFKMFEYKDLSIFGTAETVIYEKSSKKQLLRVPADELIQFVITNNALYVNFNEKHIALTDVPIIDCPNGFLGVKDLKRKGTQALYHGIFEIVNKQKGDAFYLINVLDVQDYLKGVVPNEMPIRFGLEALKAQSIAARNYVLSPRTKVYKEFDVGDSVASQVYFGANTEEYLSTKAIQETKGLIALYNWELILAQYSSTAGGYTESFENVFSEPNVKSLSAKSKPYLVAKPDMLMQPPILTESDARNFYMNKPESYDIKSPYYRWQKEWTYDELNQLLPKTFIAQSKTGFISPALLKVEDFGNLKDLKPKKRGASGKLVELDVITDKGTFTVSKELVIRRVFQKNNISLPSANVVFDFAPDFNEKNSKITAYGGGFGHGVGMSQYGAGFMGETLKMPFYKILKHYYTGISITTIPIILSSYETQRAITQDFWMDGKTADLIVDNRFNLTKLNLIINNREVVLPLENTFSGFLKPLKIDISKYLKKGDNSVTFCYPLDEGNYKAVRLYIEMVSEDNGKFDF